MLSDYSAQNLLNYLAGSLATPALPAVYLALFTTAPTSDAGTGGTRISQMGPYRRAGIKGPSDPPLRRGRDVSCGLLIGRRPKSSHNRRDPPMNTVIAYLRGKKTYIVAAAIIAYAGAEYWSGMMTQDQAVQIALNALGLGTLRAGVSKVQS